MRGLSFRHRTWRIRQEVWRRLERHTHIVEVEGSSPSAPTREIKRALLLLHLIQKERRG